MRLSCRFLMRSLVVMVAVCAVASGVPANAIGAANQGAMLAQVR